MIGDNVNVASRIENACPPDGVLVSGSTWASVNTADGANNQFSAEVQPPIQVKNRDQPVLTYLIVPVIDSIAKTTE